MSFKPSGKVSQKNDILVHALKEIEEKKKYQKNDILVYSLKRIKEKKKIFRDYVRTEGDTKNVLGLAKKG